MALNPYLFFDGTCEQALNFYREALGAETVSLMRYKDGPPMEGVPPEHAWRAIAGPPRTPPPTDAEGNVTPGYISSFAVMSGSEHKPTQPFQGFSLSLGVPDAQEGQKLFDKLAAGGQVTMPFGKTFWTSGFGMCKGKFGVPWMVNAEH